jgi:hypothetical protein
VQNSKEYFCKYNINIKRKQTAGLKLANMIFASTLVPYPTNLSTREYGQPNEV